jgi:Domain of unknown function (DUF4382)
MRGNLHVRYAQHALLLASLVTWVGCGGSVTAPSTGPVLTVSLKDSPFSDAKALLVTFSEVSVHASGGDFKTLPFTGGGSTRTCDLKKLTSATDVLGTGPLTAGHYTQIRLVVASAALYFDNASSSTPCASSISAPAGRSATVLIPSGDIRLNREFDLATTGATTSSILLDFDGDQSVKDTGNGAYVMTPVISIVSVQ